MTQLATWDIWQHWSERLTSKNQYSWSAATDILLFLWCFQASFGYTLNSRPFKIMLVVIYVSRWVRPQLPVPRVRCVPGSPSSIWPGRPTEPIMPPASWNRWSASQWQSQTRGYMWWPLASERQREALIMLKHPDGGNYRKSNSRSCVGDLKWQQRWQFKTRLRDKY